MAASTVTGKTVLKDFNKAFTVVWNMYLNSINNLLNSQSQTSANTAKII